MTNWTEREIGYCLARGLFASRAVVLVPECTYPGHECDILVVERGCRLIEVEVKATLADLLADAKKDKWYRGRLFYGPDGRHVRGEAREWPVMIWRHYYCFPEAIWNPERILPVLPAASGILTGDDPRKSLKLDVRRRARSNPEAKPLSANAVCNLARLANLRMWDALNREAGRNAP